MDKEATWKPQCVVGKESSLLSSLSFTTQWHLKCLIGISLFHWKNTFRRRNHIWQHEVVGISRAVSRLYGCTVQEKHKNIWTSRFFGLFLVISEVGSQISLIAQGEMSISVAFPAHLQTYNCKAFSHMCAFSRTYLSKSKHVWKEAPRCTHLPQRALNLKSCVLPIFLQDSLKHL